MLRCLDRGRLRGIAALLLLSRFTRLEIAVPARTKIASAIAVAVEAAVIALLVIVTVALLLRSAAAGDEGRQAGLALLTLRIAAETRLRLVLRLRTRLVLVPALMMTALLALEWLLTALLVGHATLLAFLVEILILHVGTLERLLRLMRVLLCKLLLGSGDETEIVLCVLQVTFRGDGIAGRLRIARELYVFLGDVMRGTADFHIGAIRFVHPRQRIVSAPVAPAHTLVLIMTVSHFRPSLLCAAMPPYSRTPAAAGYNKKPIAANLLRLSDPGACLGDVHMVANRETNSASGGVLPLVSRSRLSRRE